ncbi:hypothetical protein EYZ11_011221 [Aspergillus tanneri]|uniref:Uncharacterized protein n=1 Tax=Aspergillus tanneri TaxID=1220188 RepID=A0A4S3J5I3_9EURO|nr:hypothetical protein EYZ11_011221 [Aspergillus tanneri]
MTLEALNGADRLRSADAAFHVEH